jgi:glycerophosphoryl diester phosphodiesterase
MHPTPVSKSPLTVGHRGAAALAPENTIAAIGAGLEAGADAVELDVRRGLAGRLVLGHGRRDAADSPTTLEEALAFLAAAPGDRGLLLDVKEPGLAPDLVEEVAAAGLGSRTIACAREPSVLTELGRADPSLRRAWSLKRARHARRLPVPRRDLAVTLAAALEGGIAELLSIHRSLATPDVIEAAHAASGEVYVWGLGRASRAQLLALAALGVDGLIGDDPGLLRAALGRDPGSDGG